MVVLTSAIRIKKTETRFSKTSGVPGLAERFLELSPAELAQGRDSRVEDRGFGQDAS